MRKEFSRNLYGIAVGQHGFFTAGQAKNAGYQDAVHPYHVRNGDWVRMARGIYRLGLFPPAARPELDVALLWTRNRAGRLEGVLSHRTALEVRGQVPADPGVVHITVPGDFRRNSAPPAGVVLHRKDLAEKDREMVAGYVVVSEIQTMADLQGTGDLSEHFGEPEPEPEPEQEQGTGDLSGEQEEDTGKDTEDTGTGDLSPRKDRGKDRGTGDLSSRRLTAPVAGSDSWGGARIW